MQKAVGLDEMSKRVYCLEGLDCCAESLKIWRQNCRDRGLYPVLLVAEMASFVRRQTYAAFLSLLLK